jgi:hypothetical protein
MRTLVLALLFLLLTACSEDSLQWWESTDIDGRLFVLNKRTGELYALEENQLQVVNRESDAWMGPANPGDAEQIARGNSLDRSRWIVDDILKVALTPRK